MLMVIFGAGASYDSSLDLPLPEPVVPVISAGQQNFGTPPPPLPPPPSDPGVPWRPPLTKDLFLDPNARFGEIVQKYPRLHGILPFLRRPRNGSVEQQLELYLDEASADQERTRQLFSVRYYLHDLFRMVSEEWLKRTNGVTNYAVLIDQLRHLNTAGEPVCLVSFNYDLLLDHARLPSRVNSQPLERDFDGHPMFKLLKPHGSVDWARFTAGAKGTKYVEASHRPGFFEPPPSQGPRLAPENIIEQAPNLSDEYVRANATDAHQIYNFNWPIVPAIAIPVQTKTADFFEWPSSHRTYFEELLPRVTKILIIGWQGKEAHFLKLLRERLPTGGITQITHLQVVGSNSTGANAISQQFIADIRRHVKKEDLGPTQGGFSSFVQQGSVEFLFKE